MRIYEFIGNIVQIGLMATVVAAMLGKPIFIDILIYTFGISGSLIIITSLYEIIGGIIKNRKVKHEN